MNSAAGANDWQYEWLAGACRCRCQLWCLPHLCIPLETNWEPTSSVHLPVLTYFFRFWGDLVHQSAPPTDGSSLPTAALLHKLLPGRPDLVDEAVRSVRERRPWKKVGITNNLGHLT